MLIVPQGTLRACRYEIEFRFFVALKQPMAAGSRLIQLLGQFEGLEPDREKKKN
jgi:hypothetical protein